MYYRLNIVDCLHAYYILKCFIYVGGNVVKILVFSNMLYTWDGMQLRMFSQVLYFGILLFYTVIIL